jgi:hypothetical protein
MVLTFGVLSGPVVFGDATTDRAQTLDDLEKSHKETVADLQKELNKHTAVFDAQVAKQKKLERRSSGASGAGANIMAREHEKAEKLRKEALRKGKALREQIDELAFQYKQDRRRVMLNNPQPGDPTFVESEGLVYTAKELKEQDELRRNNGSPEVVADAYIQTLINDGVLETATRTRTRPFQLTNGPPMENTMMVFYQCRYTSKGGFVNDREGHIVVTRDARGFWFVSQITHLSGIEF